MYCSVCGQQLQANQPSCPRCGRAVTEAMPPVSPQGPMPSVMAANLFQSRVERHAHTLGILWIAYAIWLLISWAFAATILTGMFGGMGHGPFGQMVPFGDRFPFGHIPWLIPFITFFLVARSALSLITGIGLLRRESWGRTLALVTAFLSLIKPLTGTVLGIYTLWVLLPSDSALEYEQLTQ